jgi:predicted site-specific integrase-resolvase
MDVLTIQFNQIILKVFRLFIKILQNNLLNMAGRIIVTNYDREEVVSMIKDAFKNELCEILRQKEKAKDDDILFTRQEVADLLKISLVTLYKYQKEGTLPSCKLSWHVYFRKGDTIKALEIPSRYHGGRYNN